MKLGFLSKRRIQKTSSERDQFCALLKRSAQLGDNLPVDDQIKLCQIAEQAGMTDKEIESGAEIHRQYTSDKPQRDAIPQITQSLAQARIACDEFAQETDRIKKERTATLDAMKRKVGNAQSQLDAAREAKVRCDRAEIYDWKILGLAPVKTTAHIFQGVTGHMLAPGVKCAVNVEDFASGRLDADSFQFVKSFNQCADAFNRLVDEAKSYRKLPVDDPAARVISDPGTIRASSPEPTFRSTEGPIVSTLPENNSKTKWQILTNAGAL